MGSLPFDRARARRARRWSRKKIHVVYVRVTRPRRPRRRSSFRAGTAWCLAPRACASPWRRSFPRPPGSPRPPGPRTPWVVPEPVRGVLPQDTRAGPAPPAQPGAALRIFGPRSVRAFAATPNDRIVPCTKNPGSTRYTWHEPPEHPRSVANRCATKPNAGASPFIPGATLIEPAGVTTRTARGRRRGRPATRRRPTRVRPRSRRSRSCRSPSATTRTSSSRLRLGRARLRSSDRRTRFASTARRTTPLSAEESFLRRRSSAPTRCTRASLRAFAQHALAVRAARSRSSSTHHVAPVLRVRLGSRRAWTPPRETTRASFLPPGVDERLHGPRLGFLRVASRRVATIGVVGRDVVGRAVRTLVYVHPRVSVAAREEATRGEPARGSVRPESSEDVLSGDVRVMEGVDHRLVLGSRPRR